MQQAFRSNILEIKEHNVYSYIKGVLCVLNAFYFL